MGIPDGDNDCYVPPTPNDLSAPCSSRCSTLRDFLGVLHAEMDIAWNRESVSREQVHRWSCMIREVLADPVSKNPLDGLSQHSLLFLLERCDFSEPWLGIGFASRFKSEIKDALNGKVSDA